MFLESFSLYFKVFSLNLISFVGGAALAWSSPYLPRLNGIVDPENNPLGAPIGPFEESIIVSLIAIGAVISPVLSAILSDKYGRKLSLLLCGVPIYVNFWITAFATKLWQLYLARFLAGLTVGSLYSIIPIYVAELSEKHNRGALSCILVICNCLGNLFIYILGSFFTVKISSFICLVPATLFFVLVIVFLPESSYYLVSKGEDKKAEVALQNIRGRYNNKAELEEIKLTINQKTHFTLREFIKSGDSMRKLLIPISLVFFQQFSGVNAILFYLQSIFNDAQVNLPPDISAIVIGCVQFISALITPLIIDRLGRRILLFMSGVGTTVTLIMLATFFYIKDNNYDYAHLNWLPICSLVLFIMSYCVGFGPVPFTILGEIFDQTSKGLASTLTVSFCFGFMCIISIAFPYMVTLIGSCISFLFFVIFTVTSLFYVYYYVPETKGKSLYDIQK